MATPIPSTLPQIGPGTLAILRANGITDSIGVLFLPTFELRTAAKLADIPGIGPARTAILREWAQSVPWSEDEKLAILQAKEARAAKKESERKAVQDRIEARRAGSDPRTQPPPAAPVVHNRLRRQHRLIGILVLWFGGWAVANPTGQGWLEGMLVGAFALFLLSLIGTLGWGIVKVTRVIVTRHRSEK